MQISLNPDFGPISIIVGLAQRTSNIKRIPEIKTGSVLPLHFSQSEDTIKSTASVHRSDYIKPVDRSPNQMTVTFICSVWIVIARTECRIAFNWSLSIVSAPFPIAHS